MAVSIADRPSLGPDVAAVTSDWAIRTEGLTKRFGSVAVVDDLHLSVPTGSIFGFLGPNGAGKTTTIRMLLGLIAPSDGTVELLGQQMPAKATTVLPLVGALAEGPACYPWLTGRQNLERLDAAGPERDGRSRNARVDGALERVGLIAAGDKKYRAYSLGMRQRLGLASALLRPRQLLILDEPTNGMDPQGTREIRHLIREVAADGSTVFISSHLLAEIEQICTYVGVMSLGRLLVQESLISLQRAATARLRVDTEDVNQAAEVFRGLGLSPVINARSVVADDSAHAHPDEVCARLVNAGVRVFGFAVERPTLEDMFVALTGEGFDVAR
jgi:ABC-2 type transport system ATP-binding protein